GRLTIDGATGGFEYLTVGGWTIRISKNWGVVGMFHGNGLFKYEMWGAPSGDPLVALTHENLNGKHIKDRLVNRRTHLLPGGTLITFNLPPGDPLAGTVSIYDDDQTHRIDLAANAVTRSCAIGMYEEDQEPDGETSHFLDTETGMLFEHVYDELETPSGLPGQRIMNLYPLGRLYLDDPN